MTPAEATEFVKNEIISALLDAHQGRLHPLAFENKSSELMSLLNLAAIQEVAND